MEPRDEARKLYKKGKPLKEIAELLGINYNTVRQWKSRDKWDETGVTTVRNKKRCNKKRIPKPIEPEGLSEQEKLFCEIYINNFNATQAALKAEYAPKSAHVTACRLLKKDKIKDYLKELREYKRATLLVEQDDIVERYMKIAFADMTDFVTFSVKEVPIIAGGEVATAPDSKGVKRVLMRWSSEVEVKDSNYVDGGLISQISKGPSGIRIKLEDRMKALEWLSRYFEMNPMDSHKVAYDNAKLGMERERFEHQKDQDERNNF